MIVNSKFGCWALVYFYFTRWLTLFFRQRRSENGARKSEAWKFEGWCLPSFSAGSSPWGKLCFFDVQIGDISSIFWRASRDRWHVLEICSWRKARDRSHVLDFLACRQRSAISSRNEVDLVFPSTKTIHSVSYLFRLLVFVFPFNKTFSSSSVQRSPHNAQVNRTKKKHGALVTRVEPISVRAPVLAISSGTCCRRTKIRL